MTPSYHEPTDRPSRPDRTQPGSKGLGAGTAVAPSGPAGKIVNGPTEAVDNLLVHLNDPRPDPALSPDEFHAWRAIEHGLRRDLPIRRIERRARLRADRNVLFGVVAVAIGGGVAVLAGLAPVTLTLAGTVVAGLGLGTVICRTAMIAMAGRRPRLRWSRRSTR